MKKPSWEKRIAMIRSRELQITILAELEDGPRTVRQLAAKFGRSHKSFHDAFEKLYDAYMVDSIDDRRKGADGLMIGPTWVLAGNVLTAREEHDWRAREAMQKPSVPVIPRDPWIWALHGAQP